MVTYLLDWAGLLVRWLHVIAGIAWIGASFYFVWLDNHLRPVAEPERVDPGVGGELWAVHGGGFYRSQKYRVAPAMLPETLHWFYWEAYTTWRFRPALLALLHSGRGLPHRSGGRAAVETGGDRHRHGRADRRVADL
jgi:uncharacterized membrane protein